MSILVIAEHDHSKLKPATLATITAARQIADKSDADVHLLVIGHQCAVVAEAASKITGLKKVFLLDAEPLAAQTAEAIVPQMIQRLNAENYTHLLAPSTTFGKDFLPRVAALLDVQQISGIIEVVDPNTFVRPIYAGNALATVQSDDKIKVLSVMATGFEPASIGESSVEVATITDLAPIPSKTRLVERSVSGGDKIELTSARVVISGGRGLQNGENFQLLEALAAKLGGAVGASRAAVDAGFVPNDYQVGQTGKIVAPELYIAVGISGAIQHIAGMRDSKVIVAINKDPEAPIFQVADYGLVGDALEVVPKLTALL
jgi:electron transfer flavoprotein alpha subunit